MLSHITLFFKQIHCDDFSIKDIIDLIKKNEYTKTKKEGFVIKEVNENIIYANYIYQYPSYINKFDDELFDFKREKIYYNNVINFSIDFTYNLISIFSNSSKANRLITEIGKLTHFKIIIEDVEFSPQNIIHTFKKSNYVLNISSLRIKNFRVNQNLLGTFWAKILDEKTVLELINNYSKDIIYFGASTTIGSKNVSLGFYHSGLIMIFNKIENIYELVDKLKIILFEEE